MEVAPLPGSIVTYWNLDLNHVVADLKAAVCVRIPPDSLGNTTACSGSSCSITMPRPFEARAHLRSMRVWQTIPIPCYYTCSSAASCVRFHSWSCEVYSCLSEFLEWLEQLWRLCYPGQLYPGPKGSHWTNVGFQGLDPHTDVRGARRLGVFFLIRLLRESPVATSLLPVRTLCVCARVPAPSVFLIVRAIKQAR